MGNRCVSGVRLLLKVFENDICYNVLKCLGSDFKGIENPDLKLNLE